MINYVYSKFLSKLISRDLLKEINWLRLNYSVVFPMHNISGIPLDMNK